MELQGRSEYTPGQPRRRSESLPKTLDEQQVRALTRLRRVSTGRALPTQLFIPDQAVLREGVSGEHLYIATGDGGGFKVTRGGQEIGVMRGAGSIVGELAALYRCKRTATVESLDITEALVLTAADVAGLANLRYPYGQIHDAITGRAVRMIREELSSGRKVEEYDDELARLGIPPRRNWLRDRYDKLTPPLPTVYPTKFLIVD